MRDPVAGRRAGTVACGHWAMEVSDVQKEHYGAIAAVLVGYLICRLLSFHIVDVLGSLGGHGRPGDTIVGAVFGGIPFVALTLYAGLLLRGVVVERLRPMRVVAAVGWLFGGGVMGLLPYSRFGTETNLVQKERVSAPGLLHALDVTIVAGLIVVVALLLVSLRAHPTDRTPR
jgi:hypothetical protein